MADQKRCPGVESLGSPAHDLPADLEHFNSNGAGLSTRCRVDGNLYGRAWAVAKRAGEKFSGKAGSEVPPSVQAMLAGDRIGNVIADGLADALSPEDEAIAQAGLELSNAAAERVRSEAEKPTLVVVKGTRQQLTYHDQLAVKAARGKAPGYSGEAVGGVIYALPDGPTASTPEGQAALQVVNEAKAAERRRRDADRKRLERATKKATAAAAASS